MEFGLRGLALGTGLALGLAGGGPGGAGAAPAIRWAPSIDAGLAEAKSKGLPLMVALNMDHERANDALMKELYGDPVFLAAAAKCVCTIGCLGAHDEVKDPASGRMVCSKFGSLTCAEHQAVDQVVRVKWLHRGPKDLVDCPRHFFLAPGGKILFHRTWTLEPKDLAALMARAGEACAPAALAAWDTVEARLKRTGEPLRPVREEAVRALAGMKDAAVDGKLGELAKAATAEDLACEVLDAFAAAMTPARRGVAAPFLAAKGPATRMHAAAAIEASQDPEALKELLAALGKERDAGVRGVLYRCIAGLGPTSPEARAVVAGGFKEKGDLLAQVCVAAAPWAQDPQVFASLKSVAFGEGTPAARCAAVWALGLSKHRELATPLREIKDPTRRGLLSKVAEEAALMLTDGGDPVEYRRRARDFAPSPVRHPGDPEE
jgi:hypothetical protein